ncbi:hypothetical protein COO60DRAFT_1543933 [Scenedesmus sp. NREL 46B-D3]|nr:hypothetical protein COO60DRAFT_1543933 [Scenedesmus sp. NREL 46B-D3]
MKHTLCQRTSTNVCATHKAMARCCSSAQHASFSTAQERDIQLWHCCTHQRLGYNKEVAHKGPRPTLHNTTHRQARLCPESAQHTSTAHTVTPHAPAPQPAGTLCSAQGMPQTIPRHRLASSCACCTHAVRCTCRSAAALLCHDGKPLQALEIRCFHSRMNRSRETVTQHRHQPPLQVPVQRRHNSARLRQQTGMTSCRRLAEQARSHSVTDSWRLPHQGWTTLSAVTTATPTNLLLPST